MLTPEPGQDVEVVIRGRVRKVVARGHLALVTRTDGQDQWIEIPNNLMDAIEWRVTA